MIDIEDDMLKTVDIHSLQTLAPVHGVPVEIEIAKNWECVETFQARSDDVVIATYPKAGTTWMSEIVDMIYNGGDLEKCRRDVIYKRVPVLELQIPGMPSGVETLKATPSPRLVKTHLPIQLMPESFWEKNSKVIYVARNAKDVAVSYFYFYNMAKFLPDPGPWDIFLDSYMKGNVCYGPWQDHVKGWWEKKNNYNILYLFYEDLKVKRKSEIRKILQFLEVELSDDILEKIAFHTSFEEMKNNDMVNYRTVHKLLLDQSCTSFMRKGVVGDWKNHFTVAQNEKFDEDYKRQMSGTDLHFKTEI
ncbi:sulfotransferase 1 family member D1-like isoform X1 [Pseudophryne corroboree]|uniref:sulfotransferase 1 family member D1-like isoform X1 n=1 Tax=Pseudophryne corroboree TaxID=495146 RepID=UPI00308212A9